MHVAGVFPGEDDAIARAPEQLVVGDHGMEGAARTIRSVPEFAAFSRVNVGETNRPRLSRGTHWAKRAAGGRDAVEGNLLSIGRPNGIGIAIDAWVEITQ